MNRRNFLQFLGFASAGISLAPKLVFGESPFEIIGIQPSTSDHLELANGLSWNRLVSWNDPISDQEFFGNHNDFIAYLPSPESSDIAYLWVNNEYFKDILLHGKKRNTLPKTKAEIDLERKQVGGSFIKLIRYRGNWVLHPDTSENFRIDGTTKIPFDGNHNIEGKAVAEGTLANCAGGQTPMGTILTCEENFEDYYGLRFRNAEPWPSYYGWDQHYKNPPEHYGWVVEVNPKTKSAVKRIGLGRMSHECATVVELEDGRLVVYTGDDMADEHLYKFISSNPHDLESGELFVASLEKGEWISLSREKQPILQENFDSQKEVLIHVREAAKRLGATPLDRPEDIVINPKNGDVLVATTNNYEKENYLGSILKVSEEGAQHESLRFSSETYLSGGLETGFACPDNLCFDPAGNLWITTDISGSVIEKGPYQGFGNNGLFVVPVSGEQAGKCIQLASAPVDAEFTGPCFSPDGKTLFLSVQHPGERSPSLDALTSHWPEGGESLPKSSVVTIQGPLLDQLSQPKKP